MRELASEISRAVSHSQGFRGYRKRPTLEAAVRAGPEQGEDPLTTLAHFCSPRGPVQSPSCDIIPDSSLGAGHTHSLPTVSPFVVCSKAPRCGRRACMWVRRPSTHRQIKDARPSPGSQDPRPQPSAWPSAQCASPPETQAPLSNLRGSTGALPLLTALPSPPWLGLKVTSADTSLLLQYQLFSRQPLGLFHHTTHCNL